MNFRIFYVEVELYGSIGKSMGYSQKQKDAGFGILVGHWPSNLPNKQAANMKASRVGPLVRKHAVESKQPADRDAKEDESEKNKALQRKPR